MNIIYTHSYLFGGHWHHWEYIAKYYDAGSMWTTTQEVNFKHATIYWSARGICEHYKN